MQVSATVFVIARLEMAPIEGDPQAIAAALTAAAKDQADQWLLQGGTLEVPSHGTVAVEFAGAARVSGAVVTEPDAEGEFCGQEHWFDEDLGSQDDVDEALEAALGVLRAHPEAATEGSPIQRAIRKIGRLVGEG